MKLIRNLISSCGLAILAVFAGNAHAGWSCDATSQKVRPEQCQAAGSQSTPEAFATAYIKSMQEKYPSRAPYTLTACTPSGNEYRCDFTFLIGTSTLSDSVSAIKDTPNTCPETLESRSENVSVTKSGNKYYVAWSVSSVTSDICHNSCSYLASSAATSTCYRITGSTDTGFCNYVVGLNSASPSCSGESGYKAPGTGDSLNAGSDTGGGSDGGNDGGSSGGGSDGGSSGGNNGGSSGGGNSGGSSGSSFDGELKFSSPGELDADSIIEREQNGLASKSFVLGLQTSLQESEFGKSLTEFQESTFNSSAAGICPTPSFVMYGTTVRFEEHCNVITGASSILTVVFLVGWSILALRIALSA